MEREVEILGKVILNFVKQKKLNFVDILLERIREYGKDFLIPHIKEYLIKNIKKESGIEVMTLVLAFDIDEKVIIKFGEKLLNKKVEIKKKVINRELILGGQLIGEGVLIDFSLRNLLLKILDG